ncbi:MAG TPA: response regulator [Candidatus Acidoferrum sp.]|nr:response regulator [Candidatus Acidoferrum sp.]
MLRILIVDDHEAVRRGVRSLLSARHDWVVCGEAFDGLEAIAKAKELRPALILMDIAMPRMDGLEATRVLRRELPETQVVLISQNDPAVVSIQADQVGAAGFVPKNNLADSLLTTLDQLLQHQQPARISEPRSTTSTLPDWLTGSGELGRLIFEHDWYKTPLGPIQGWPQSLKTSVSLMLNSHHPMWIGWGPQATFLYNKAYIQVLSLTKHPWALGRPASEVWSEIWDVCGPLADKVFQRGEASFVDEVRLFMSREDFLEETYYSFSYSPIRDESGNVGGLFCPSTEVTAKVINARQLQTLSALSANAYLQKTAEAACAAAVATLAKNLDDIPFCVLYLTERDAGGHEFLRKCGEYPATLAGVAPELSDVHGDLQDDLWALREVARDRQAKVILTNSFTGLPLSSARQPVTQAMVIPLTSGGDDRTLGVLILGVSPTRRLHTEYLTFFELIAGEVAAAIQNARAAEDERNRIEALAELDRAKTAFFSNVSHEFRTPLTLMLGPLEELLARSPAELPPAAKGQLEMVNRNGARLLRLVNTLLDFSRIEAGRVQAVYESTDLAAFTVELASVFRSATERAGIDLIVDCPVADHVYVDRDMWEKIVLNLVSNAFKFTFDGSIEVSLHHVDGAAELRVKDSGVGIPAEEMPHLFDRFHRVASTRSRTNEGSGIGLALVQELVKLHCGTVRAESRLGHGTTFIVSIPLGKQHLPVERIGSPRKSSSTAIGASPFVEEALRWLPDNDPKSAEELPSRYELTAVPCPPGDSPAESRERILIADDNSDMRQYLVRLLSERYEAEAVPDGRAALLAARKQPPDLILSDVMMPILDGFALLKELRSDSQLKEIPFILLSARAGEESRLEGVGSGADDYMVKPFSARELIARVEAHLKMHRIRQQAKLKLQQLTREYETLINQAPLGIYLVDSALRIRHVNPVALPFFGDISNLIGRDFDDVIHILWAKDFADEVVRIFRHTLETGEPYASPELIEYRADRDTTEHYEWRADRISMPEGGFGIVCYFRDISAQVWARQELRKSQADLEQKVQERTRELLRASDALGELSARLLRTQDEERRRIARELHDGAGQLLAAMGMEISVLAKEKNRLTDDAASSMESISSLLTQLTGDIRTMSHLLHPPLLDEVGLQFALQEYVNGFAQRSGIQILAEIEPQVDRLARESELSIFRIVQECLTNIHRHSGSKTAVVRLARRDDQICLEVSDQGCGLSPDLLNRLNSGQSAGVGFRGMRERIRQLGGLLKITSAGAGTSIVVTLPATSNPAASGIAGDRPRSDPSAIPAVV